MFDGDLLGQQMVEIVRGYVAAELEPMRASNEALAAENKALAERLAALEARELLLPEKGEPGEVDMTEVAALVDTAVKSAVAVLPVPQDGKDGLGLADALIDRAGNLVLAMTDGSTRNLGLVIGKDGEDGKAGETFTLDDFDIVPYDDERTFKFCFTRGEAMHSFELSFPVMLDRGVWGEEKAYQKGDAVTWAGSLWTAQRDAPGKPDTPDSGWRLAVKRGRDGKDLK